MRAMLLALVLLPLSAQADDSGYPSCADIREDAEDRTGLECMTCSDQWMCETLSEHGLVQEDSCVGGQIWCGENLIQLDCIAVETHWTGAGKECDVCDRSDCSYEGKEPVSLCLNGLWAVELWCEPIPGEPGLGNSGGCSTTGVALQAFLVPLLGLLASLGLAWRLGRARR